MLREAERNSIIPFNYLATVEPLVSHGEQRGVFSQGELQRLFPEDYKQAVNIWGRLEYVSLFCVLATTGLRKGEVRALQWKHVIGDERGKALVIERAVKHNEEIGTTKTGTERVVVLNRKAQDYLSMWQKESPFTGQDDLIFFGQNADTPITGKTLLIRFQKALENVKISREGRNLIIHSFRHTYNTLLKSVLPKEILQATTGHTSDRMTEHYNHPTAKDTYEAVIQHGDVFDKLF